MQGTYTPWLVCLSIALATALSYATLRLAARLTVVSDRPARPWIAGGSLVLGIGLWAVHFIALLSLQLPVNFPYAIPATLLAIVIAIATAALAGVRRDPATTVPRGLLALGVGGGIWILQYTGFSAPCACVSSPKVSRRPNSSTSCASSAAISTRDFSAALRCLQMRSSNSSRACARSALS